MNPRVCLFICLLSFRIRSGLALLCYSRPCQPSANNICIKLCPPEYNSCEMTVPVEDGKHTVTNASCSQSTDNCTTEPRQCNLERKKESRCCCTTDYCNGGYRDANEIYPFLTVSRPLPFLLPNTSALSPDHLTCEAYICFNTVYPNCNHSYISCPLSFQDHNFMFVCTSSYSYTTGYLVPVNKGCTVVHKSAYVQEDSCHVDNPLEVAEGIYSCYCSGDYCNQNDSFTHVIRLISYGEKECREMNCQHDCQVVNGQPTCQCRVGYKLHNLTDCEDINECAINNGAGCQQKCLNTEGSFECTCYAGFQYDALYNTCESIEGVFCYNRYCLNDCTPSISFHCSNDQKLNEGDNNHQINLQYCASYYIYYPVTNRLRPLEAHCELALYGTNRDCLSKTECNYEVLDNKSLSILYWCCCRGDNCIDPRVIPSNVISYSTVSSSTGITTTVMVLNTVTNIYSVSPDISLTDVIVSSVLGSILCLCLIVVFIIALSKLILCRRQIKTLKVKRIANEDASNEDYCLQEVDETTLYVPDIHVYVPKIASSAVRNPDVAEIENTRESIECDVEVYSTIESESVSKDESGSRKNSLTSIHDGEQQEYRETDV